MFRAHELISALIPESQDCKDCISAVKFDLGDTDSVNRMVDVSRHEFFDIPAPICLFQVMQDMDIHFFLAKKEFGGVIWRRFGKQLNDGFRWVQEDVEFFIQQEPRHIFASRISTNELIGSYTGDDGLINNKWGLLSDSEQWSISRFLNIASAIEVFSCSNVVTIEHKPPKLINEKRKNKGRTPFYSYRTIHITGSANEKNANQKGTHESPRLHLRRGHIRKLSDGRRIWVTACLVGDKDKGFSAHDYKVRV